MVLPWCHRCLLPSGYARGRMQTLHARLCVVTYVQTCASSRHVRDMEARQAAAACLVCCSPTVLLFMDESGSLPAITATLGK
jgi:hypothetical protein